MIRIRSKARISKRSKTAKRWIYFIGGILLLIISIFIYYILSPKYIISQVAVVGQSLSSKDDVLELTENYLNKKVLSYIPVHNWLLFPKNQFQLELSHNPAYKNVEIEIGGDYIHIQIDERIPSYVWCGDNPEIIESCMFVDEDAIIFAKAPVFEGGAYTKLFMSVPPDVIGKLVQDKDTLGKMKKNIELWKDVKIDINAVEFGDGTTATYHAVSGLKLFIDKQMDPTIIINNIHAFLVSGEEPVTLNDLEYIDLRSPHKIFFKRK